MNALKFLQNVRMQRGSYSPNSSNIVGREDFSRKRQIQQVRAYPHGGNIGSGAGKGGGDGGNVRSSGGSLGEFGAAHEEEYFFRKQREQLERMKNKMKKDAEKDPKSEQKGSDE